MVQTVCNHSGQVLTLQKYITAQRAQHIIPADCDCSKVEGWVKNIPNALATAKRRLTAQGASQELQGYLATMTQDTRVSGTVVRNLWMHSANVLTMAVREAPAAPKGQECCDKPVERID
jgi:hypothetical protein